MHIDVDVVPNPYLWLTGMQPHPRVEGHALGPGMGGKRLLDGHRCMDSIHRTVKHDEEAIALRVHLVTTVCLEDGAQEAAIVVQQTPLVFALLL